MTALNFPGSPTVGDTYNVGSRTWTWTTSYATTTSRTNLITNPNFEASIANWVNIGALSTVTRSVADGAVSGSASLKVVRATNSGAEVNTGAWLGASSANYSSINPSTAYTISTYVRKISGVDPSLFCSIAFYTAAGVYITESSPVLTAITSTTSWVRISATATSPANAAFVNPLVRENATAGKLASTWQADGFLLEAGSSVLPYFDGVGTAPYTGYTSLSISWDGAANASTSTGTWGLDSSLNSLWTINAGALSTGVVGANELAAGAVTTAKIATNAITATTLAASPTNNYILTADSSTATGTKWATAQASGGLTTSTEGAIATMAIGA